MGKIELKYLCITDFNIDTNEKFLNLLTSRATIEVNSDTNSISLSGSEEQCAFRIKSINVGDSSNQSKYTIEFEFDDIDSAEKLNRTLGKLFGNLKDDKIIMLKDGISKEYSHQAYEYLYDVETALRSFITELMTFMGKPDWFKKDVNKILNISDSQSLDERVLYSRNFDQLREFLFTNYSEYKSEDLIKEIIDEKDHEIRERLVSDLESKIPKTNWEKFIKNEASKHSINESEFQKLLENIYRMRNRIAHCNTFNRDDFNNFKESCHKIMKYISKLTEIIEKERIFSEDHSIENDISAIFAPIDSYNTIVVPAYKDGFEEVFLGEDRWYSVSIWDGRIDSIDYIAAYLTAPEQKITHYAKVRKIEPSPYNEKKKIIYFDGRAIQLPKPIPIGSDTKAFQRSRYTIFDRLLDASTTDDLF
ncbi:hypothetical protein HO639_09225 [Streptococcus suis]|uniref:Apea-like HEPN domain-containing protein n=1 Tax=Streptococcus suis TaxID=1307 RepID=A0A123SM97_STRSU|nr:hypothetical protein [Streptococcus suis]NQH69074.1 hypothetical protein [Streptococcus suis]NQH85705.1 hypothetical protein [Streptococcus suis]NQI06690.1 hypothetical protein [Streptococcus suis]NQN17799.1 hypothetical protein [Streptococcus suis]NQR70450.1 hypothetical protein [Streptococcus suis]